MPHESKITRQGSPSQAVANNVNAAGISRPAVRIPQQEDSIQNKAPVQRTVSIIDQGAIAMENEAETITESPDINVYDNYIEHVNYVFNTEPYKSLIDFQGPPDIHVTVIIETPDDAYKKDGSTILTGTKGGEPSEKWSTTLKTAASAVITIRLFPKEDSSGGDVMAFLLHELDLHVFPIISSLKKIRTVTDKDETQRHIENIVTGEDMQHSNVASWETYLNSALTKGQAYKAKAETLGEEGDVYIELGSEIIMGAVNDIMTHMTTPRLSPYLQQEQRETLCVMANQVGEAEVIYRSKHPDVWPTGTD